MAKRDPWFPFLQPKPTATMRIFCLPPSGAGANLFRSWRELLPKEIDLYAVQLPGRENRVAERAVDRMKDLVPQVASAVLPHTAVPFAIFGHSMGGLLGFEVARQLRRGGTSLPFHLFVSAARAPHVPDLDAHHLLPDREFLAELRKIAGFPADVLDNDELMQMLLPTIRADAAVTETYAYEAESPLECGLTVFAGEQDKQVALDEIIGWSAYSHGTFDQVICPGGHDFMMTSAATLVRVIAGTMRVARSLR